MLGDPAQFRGIEQYIKTYNGVCFSVHGVCFSVGKTSGKDTTGEDIFTPGIVLATMSHFKRPCTSLSMVVPLGHGVQ